MIVLQAPALVSYGAPAPERPDSNFKDATQSMHRLRTYIVEDSLVVRENLVATLEELLPLDVVSTAGDAWTAAQWLAQPEHAIDLLITDLFLTGGSGLDVLAAAQRLQPSCRRVVLSHYATPTLRRKCLESGAHTVFDAFNEIDTLILYCGRLAAETDAGCDAPDRAGYRINPFFSA